MPFDEEELDPHGECRAEIEKLKAALEECWGYIRHHHNAVGGWWNDSTTWDLAKNHIEPALGHRLA